VIWEWEGNGNETQQYWEWEWEWEWELLHGNGRERESKTHSHSRTPLMCVCVCVCVCGCVYCQSWLTELIEVGFSGHLSARHDLAVTSLSQLTDLVSRVIFTLTAQHSATHIDAMDLYGFAADVPAMMRRPVPSRRDLAVSRDELSATLPDQFPDAYYVALAFVVQVHKPDEVRTATTYHC